MADFEYEEILTRLSVANDAPWGKSPSVTRRRFLQVAAAGAGGLALAPWIKQLEAFAAPAVGTNEGILVVVQMGGGNDGVNTVVPITDPSYASLRSPGGVGYTQSQLHMISPTLGLNPALGRMKARYDAGDVAVVTGAGYHPPNLSHFESMANWMAGTATTSRSSGWLGRYLDGLPNAENESLYGVSIGSSVPLHMIGTNTRASGLPLTINGAFGLDRKDKNEDRMCNAIARFGAGANGIGQWGDAFGRSENETLELAQRIQPAYAVARPSSSIGSQLVLAASLINANLGIRVINVSFGSFDTHSNQRSQQEQLLGQMDAAIEAFFATLSPTFADRTVLMTFSEFGRTPHSNQSGGTDHGSSSVMFVCGARVRGGVHGQYPALNQRDQWDNLKVHVDFRQVYQAALSQGLRADGPAILGGNYSGLDLIGPIGSSEGLPPTPVTTAPPPPPPPAAGSSAAAKFSAKRAWVGGRRKVGQPRS